MAKSAKAPRTLAPRSRRKSDILGYTEEGLPIWRPDFKPVSFTVNQLEKAVRAAKLRQAEKRAG